MKRTVTVKQTKTKPKKKFELTFLPPKADVDNHKGQRKKRECSLAAAKKVKGKGLGPGGPQNTRVFGHHRKTEEKCSFYLGDGRRAPREVRANRTANNYAEKEKLSEELPAHGGKRDLPKCARKKKTF